MELLIPFIYVEEVPDYPGPGMGVRETSKDESPLFQSFLLSGPRKVLDGQVW